MVSHRVCGGGVLGNNNGSMWAPGVSMVTMWEQSEEEEEQEGDDGESDLIGCNLPIFKKKKQPLTTFGENICFNQRWKIRIHHLHLPSFSFGRCWSGQSS